MLVVYDAFSPDHLRLEWVLENIAIEFVCNESCGKYHYLYKIFSALVTDRVMPFLL